MRPDEKSAIDRLAEQKSIDHVRTVMRNARKSSPEVFQAAFERLIELSTIETSGPVARACWKMVHTIEQVRRKNGRKVRHMNRLRPKIEREGEKAALEYYARNKTEGFTEVLEYGLSHYTAEAIVLSFPAEFPDHELQKIASDRLANEGIDPTRFVGKQLI